MRWMRATEVRNTAGRAHTTETEANRPQTLQRLRRLGCCSDDLDPAAAIRGRSLALSTDPCRALLRSHPHACRDICWIDRRLAALPVVVGSCSPSADSDLLLLRGVIVCFARIVRAFLIEEQKIVKSVLRARKGTKAAAQ